jgi:hypothetical protein
VTYTPSNWYWSGQPSGQSSPIIYSSASAAVVPSTNSAYVAWLAVPNFATPWPKDATGAVTTAALDDVLTAAGLPPTGLTPLTKVQLQTYVDGKIASLFGVARTYTFDSLIVHQTLDLNTVAYLGSLNQRLASLTYPFAWTDADYVITSMTQAQLTDFIAAAFAYGDNVCALANGTAFPGIIGGSITTTAQIDALAWPT